jgi:hypothetical protein
VNVQAAYLSRNRRSLVFNMSMLSIVRIGHWQIDPPLRLSYHLYLREADLSVPPETKLYWVHKGRIVTSAMKTLLREDMDHMLQTMTSSSAVDALGLVRLNRSSRVRRTRRWRRARKRRCRERSIMVSERFKRSFQDD